MGNYVIGVGNYVIGVGNYVIANPSDLGNYMSADTQDTLKIRKPASSLGATSTRYFPTSPFKGVTEDGEVFGSPWTGKAMIDTGANRSAVYSPLVQELHLLRRGSQNDATGAQKEPAPLYLARITLLDRRADLRMVARADFDPVTAQLFEVIIGTDLLQFCRFRYNDPRGRFTLEYHRP